MEFEHLVPARDFLYLAALFFGAGLGCILKLFRLGKYSRLGNMIVTAGLCFFYGAVAALTAAIIYSNWMIFAESSLYLPLIFLTAFMVVAVLFPAAAGFPLIIFSGVFVVWMGYTCLRFPVIDDSSQGRVLRDGSGQVHVWLHSYGEADMESSFSYRPAGDDTVLEFLSFTFSPAKTMPLVGGLRRGIIAEIRNNSGRLYVNPRLDENFRIAETWRRSFSLLESLESLETGTILPGRGMTIFFDGAALIFR